VTGLTGAQYGMGKSYAAAALLACCAGIPGFGQYKTLNPQISTVVSAISTDNITNTLKTLEAFGTRNLLSSQEDSHRGIGAARRWIFDQFASFSPRLEVAYDPYRVKKIVARNSRVPRDVDLYNIVAVLPGKVHPEQRILITAHYDTLVLAGPTGASLANGETAPAAEPDTDSPGVTDDGSGVACVLELARVLSQYEFEKTLVFITFAGEEEGLLGSTLYSAKARRENQKIEAVLNNDIIGFTVSGNGRTSDHRVNLFSDDPADSPSRTVARYARAIGERYLPSMQIDLEFRADRFGRGGDHTPFALEGFGAVRFSSPEEDYSHEHTSTDTFEHTSPPYIARVTQLNAAIAASLAWAPSAPAVTEEVERNGQKTTQLLLNRGESRYDARLSWKHENPEPGLAGYAIVMRRTTSPYWEREIFVDLKTEYTFPGLPIDEWVFGVKAIDKDGNESLATPYVPAPRAKRVVEVY